MLYSERLDALTPCPLCGSDYIVEFFVSSVGGLIQDGRGGLTTPYIVFQVP
jgi:hypothetical protein